VGRAVPHQLRRHPVSMQDLGGIQICAVRFVRGTTSEVILLVPLTSAQRGTRVSRVDEAKADDGSHLL